MGVLRNVNDERFCQLVVAGTDVEEAYKTTGGIAKNIHLAANRKLDNKHVRKRITELMEQAARKAQLSRSEIIQRMVEDWEMCRQLGQMGPAATNARLLGSELHGMFIERREVGGPGDFDRLSADELMTYIKSELEKLGPDAANQLGIKLDDGAILLPPVKHDHSQDMHKVQKDKTDE